MHLRDDYIAPTPRGGRCRVRLFEPDQPEDSYVVIVTEPPDNPGMSVTNSIEEIAASVLVRHLLPAKRTVWVEHYESGARGTPEDPHTFDLVTFSRDEPRDVLRAGRWVVELGEPSWRPLDRATVETLVGGPLR